MSERVRSMGFSNFGSVCLWGVYASGVMGFHEVHFGDEKGTRKGWRGAPVG